MTQFTRWLMVGSVVASGLAGPTAEACWLTGCCGGAPRTTFYAPAPVVTAVPNPCNTCDPCAANTCTPGLAATPTTFAQPTTALMPVTPVTAYRPLFGGLFSRPQPVTAYMPYTASYAATTPYTAGYTPYTAGYTPYTSYRPVAVAPTSYAVPVTYSTPVTVQYAPQPVAQATYYAPTTTTLPTTTTYMPTTTVAPAPAPGCNCHSSTSTGTTGQYWTPSSTTAVVSAAPITNGAVMTSGSPTTFGTSNQGSQSVIQQSAPQPAPNQDKNVQPIEDPIKKSSTSAPLTPGRENDPRNKTALVPLVDNSQLVETKTNSAPLVRSLEELAPFNPVRMTSHVR